jgi:hypothetical protein
MIAKANVRMTMTRLRFSGLWVVQVWAARAGELRTRIAKAAALEITADSASLCCGRYRIVGQCRGSPT